MFNDTAVLLSACAAVISAICAYLTFQFSRKLSTRERIDILKAEILRVVSPIEEGNKWRNAVSKSSQENRSVVTDVKILVGLLGAEYEKDEWIGLLPAAIEQLKKEGYDGLLGMEKIYVGMGTE